MSYKLANFTTVYMIYVSLAKKPGAGMMLASDALSISDQIWDLYDVLTK